MNTEKNVISEEALDYFECCAEILAELAIIALILAK